MGKKLKKIFRKIKAYYILIVLVLGIGAAGYFYFYAKLTKPRLEQLHAAAHTWETARNDADEAEARVPDILLSYISNSVRLIDNYRNFKDIQGRQPNIFSMTEFFEGRPREGLRLLYEELTSGRLINRLNNWTRGYRFLTNRPEFVFTGTLGFEETLTSVRLVVVPFGEQKYVGLGYADLLRKVRSSYGYGNTPLIITGMAAGSGAQQSSPAGGAPVDGSAPAAAPTGGLIPAAGPFTIVVDRDNPRHTPNRPYLTMSINATGAFFTKGWDPNGSGIRAKLDNAKEWAENPKELAPLVQPTPLPRIFFFFGDNPKTLGDIKE